MFFKFKVEENVVTQIGIEYYLDNNHYSLVYGDSHYEENRQTLIDSFGESICSTIDGWGYYYQNGIGADKGGFAGLNGGGISITNYKTNCALD